MSKNKILIVEDNTVLLERLRNWLEQDGYEVFTAIEEPPAQRGRVGTVGMDER